MDTDYGTGQFPVYHFRKSERSTAVINELLNLSGAVGLIPSCQTLLALRDDSL